MTTTYTIRSARPDELAWINERYADIDFIASNPSDQVAVAEADGVIAGLGRIVPVEPHVGELGGMYVFDGYQGLGLSKRLIAFLRELPGYRTLYCLPFSELEELYAAMGFKRVAGTEGVPEHVAKKHAWCNRHYPKPVLLMRYLRGQR